MRRIDALQVHRAGVLALLRALPADPPTALLLALATRRSMRWMLEAAGIPTRGIHGELRVKGLVAVWLWTIRAWRSRRQRGPGGNHGGARRGAAPRRAGGRMARLARTAQAEAPPERREPEEPPTEGPPEAPPLERRCAAAYQERAAGGAVMATRSVATVFGGSGFIGRYIVKRLAQQGLRRARGGARSRGGRCSSSRWARWDRWCRCTPRSPTSRRCTARWTGADLVVNTVGILAERRAGRLPAHPRRGGRTGRRASPRRPASRAWCTSRRSAPIPQAASRYAATKGVGEAMLREAFPAATILRPSLVFGPEDQLFNRFAGDGAPAADHAGDLRRYAVPAGLCGRRGRCGDGRAGAGGRRRRGLRTRRPARLAFRELLAYILKETGRKRRMVDVPMGLARLQARIMELLARQAADPRSVADAAAGQRGRRRHAGPAGTGHRADAGGTGGAGLSAAVPPGRRHGAGRCRRSRSAARRICRSTTKA